MDSYTIFTINVAPNFAFCDLLHGMTVCDIRAQRSETKEVSVKYEAEICVAEPDEPLALVGRREKRRDFVEFDGRNLFWGCSEGFRGRSE